MREGSGEAGGWLIGVLESFVAEIGSLGRCSHSIAASSRSSRPPESATGLVGNSETDILFRPGQEASQLGPLGFRGEPISRVSIRGRTPPIRRRLSPCGIDTRPAKARHTPESSPRETVVSGDACSEHSGDSVAGFRTSAVSTAGDASQSWTSDSGIQSRTAPETLPT